MNWFKCLDILALLIQSVAAIVMYLNSPNNTENGSYLFDDYEYFRQIENKKNGRLKLGFLLLLIGIGLSLISTLIK
jgi:hypothetical protein